MPRNPHKPFDVAVELPDIPEWEGEEGLNFFDPNNADLNLFNLNDEENIRLSGSKLYYYKYYRGEQEYDEVYKEARSKPIAKEPLLVMGHYEPTVIEENLTSFGIELTNDQMFTFNKSYIERKLGRAPIEGDIIMPAFQNLKYEIFEAQLDSFEMYGVYHIICSAKILRDEAEILDRDPLDQSDILGGYSKG